MNISEFNHPLSGSEKRQIQFVDNVNCKVKINNTTVKAYLIGGVSLREKDYRKLFSS